jgi:hypothetical protein
MLFSSFESSFSSSSNRLASKLTAAWPQVSDGGNCTLLTHPGVLDVRDRSDFFVFPLARKYSRFSPRPERPRGLEQQVVVGRCPLLVLGAVRLRGSCAPHKRPSISSATGLSVLRWWQEPDLQCASIGRSSAPSSSCTRCTSSGLHLPSLGYPECGPSRGSPWPSLAR